MRNSRGRYDELLQPETVAALHAAVEAARRDWSYLSSLSGSGPIAKLERTVGEFLGARHVLAVSSGTAALSLALMAHGLGPGDEIIVPDYTWGQTVAPVLHVGATPVLVDIDPVTCTLSPEWVSAAGTARTRAVIAVHIFGHVADMRELRGLCRRRGWILIEDASQAFGATLSGRCAGMLGNVGCFSLGQGKPLTAGEGGLLVTENRKVYERALSLSQHPLRQRFELGPSNYPGDDQFGHNFRMHPFAAAIANAEMASFEKRMRKSQELHKILCRLMQGIAGIHPPRPTAESASAWYRFCPTLVPEEIPDLSRSRFIAALRKKGVPASGDPVAVPLHRRPALKRAALFPPGCPETARRCDCTGIVIETSGYKLEQGSRLGLFAEAMKAVVSKTGRQMPDDGAFT